MEAFGSGVAGMSEGVSDLRSVVASGEVRFTQEAADALTGCLQGLHDKIQDALSQAGRLGQEMPIGDTPAARVYKPFLATIAIPIRVSFRP